MTAPLTWLAALGGATLALLAAIGLGSLALFTRRDSAVRIV